MAPARSGVLSDAFIRQHCMKYQPVPMAAVTKVLGKTADGRPPPRPATFATMAKNLVTINPQLRMDKIVDTYREELTTVARELKMTIPELEDGTNSTSSNTVQIHPHPPDSPRPRSSFGGRDTLYRESLQLPEQLLPYEPYLAEQTLRLEDDIRFEERTATPGTRFPMVGSPLSLQSPTNAFGFPERYRTHNLPPGYTRERLMMEEMGLTFTPREEAGPSSPSD